MMKYSLAAIGVALLIYVFYTSSSKDVANPIGSAEKHHTEAPQNTHAIPNSVPKNSTADFSFVLSTPENSAESTIISHDSALVFDEHAVVEIYDDFFTRFSNAESLTEEEIQLFFSQMRTMLEHSTQARDLMRDKLRSIPAEQVVARGVLSELLSGSEAGRAILIEEANYVLNTDQTALTASMFHTLANFSDQVDYRVLEKALSIVGDSNKQDEALTVNALNYIGLLERDENASLLYKSVVANSLREISKHSHSETTRAIALQKLYRLSSSQENTEIAQEHLAVNPSGWAVTETLHALNDNQLVLTDDLRYSLRRALSRTGVTDEEIALAQAIVPGLSL